MEGNRIKFTSAGVYLIIMRYDITNTKIGTYFDLTLCTTNTLSSESFGNSKFVGNSVADWMNNTLVWFWSANVNDYIISRVYSDLTCTVGGALYVLKIK